MAELTLHFQLNHIEWTLPRVDLLCRLTPFLPLLFSFTSTFTICLIALDRHNLIVNMSSSAGRRGATVGLAVVLAWLLAAAAAAPLLYLTRLKVREGVGRVQVEELEEEMATLLGFTTRAYCVEEWGYSRGRLYYRCSYS